MQPQYISAANNQDILQAMDLSLAYIELALDGTILGANNNYLKITGYRHEELVGKNLRMLYPGEDLLSPSYTCFWERLKNGLPANGLFRRKHKNGSTIWIEATYQTLLDQNGKPDRIIAFCIDVTERIRAGETVSYLADAVNRAFIIAFYDPKGQFISGNENLLSTIGCTEQNLTDKKLDAIIPISRASQKNFQRMWSSIITGHTTTSRLRWKAAADSHVWLDCVFTPVFDINGNVEKIIQISTDITQAVQAEHYDNSMFDMFSAIINKTGAAIAITNNLNKVVFINKAFTDMFGYVEKEIAGRFATVIFGPEEQQLMGRARKCLASGRTFSGEEIAYCKDGRRLWASTQITPVFDATGKQEYTINVFTDSTELKLLEILQSRTLAGLIREVPTQQLLELLCSEIERVIPGLRVAVMLTNKTGGLDFQAASFQPLRQLENLPEADFPRFPSFRAAASGEQTTLGDIKNSELSAASKSIFGKLNINACLATAVKNSLEKVVGVVSFYFNEEFPFNYSLNKIAEAMTVFCAVIIDRDAKNTKMRMLTYYDSITGLPNRNLLVSGVEQLRLNNSLGSVKDCPYAVLYINLDRFNRINRSYTYEQGNEVLRVTARRLMALKKKSDLVGRMFADEFVFLTPDSDAHSALAKAKHIQNALAQPIRVDETEVSLTASIGISLYPDNGTALETLINDANSALLQNKSKGPGQISFFSPKLNFLARSSLSLEAHLRKAVESEHLVLCYQPQVYLRSGRLYGVEALCRWSNSKCGNIPPCEFIPLAEETGLIEKLSDWVLRESCRQLAQWRRQGLDIPTVSINLSMPNFHDTKLPDRIVAYLGAHGLSAKDLILELTESVLMDDNPATLTTINRAHELGLALSLDDFGTGYSSLSYLRDLPFSEIKLDQSFVRDMHTEDVCRRLSQAVMHLGSSLQMTVLAEGVEKMEQYDLLKQQNCHVAQGYLLAKPLPPRQLEAWVANWRPQALDDQHSLL